LAGGAADLSRAVPDGVVPRGLGYPCALPGDCDSSACVDGYCCDSFCDPADPANLCKACSVPGSEGHCVAAAAGTDPHQQCAADPATTCGKDGLCDGKGGCERWAAGTACGTASCTGGSATYAPVCDGNGTCVSPAPVSCAPYACGSATACATTCTPPAVDCAPPAVCTNGSCGKRALGQPCTAPSDCTSNFCAPQGVCCDSACTGSCVACNLLGKLGQCTPLAAGTQCAAAGCLGDSKLSPRLCDGAGTCQPATTTACTPYSCDPATAQCYARPCASSAQCAMGHTCNNGSGKCQ
ncbi:MAG TPA: hypothetical protein VF945_02650, partial [Polyangia bacterium]